MFSMTDKHNQHEQEYTVVIQLPHSTLQMIAAVFCWVLNGFKMSPETNKTHWTQNNANDGQILRS